MKIDPRIDSIHDILTPFEGDLIIPGTYCVFANDIEQFRNIDGCSFGYYKGFKGSLAPSPFVYERTVDHETCSAKFCLPYEWVQKQKESKWRAFKDHAEYKEFLNEGIIESWVKIKNKTTNEIYELMYVGGGGDKIILGGMIFSVSRLFRDFELFNEGTGEWQPFGVEYKELHD